MSISYTLFGWLWLVAGVGLGWEKNIVGWCWLRYGRLVSRTSLTAIVHLGTKLHWNSFRRYGESVCAYRQGWIKMRPILTCRDKCAIFWQCRMINRVVISLIVTQKAALICFDDGTLIEMYRLLLFTCYLGVWSRPNSCKQLEALERHDAS